MKLHRAAKPHHILLIALLVTAPGCDFIIPDTESGGKSSDSDGSPDEEDPDDSMHPGVKESEHPADSGNADEPADPENCDQSQDCDESQASEDSDDDASNDVDESQDSDDADDDASEAR